MANYKKINLALQGGGSHGAFTWGVLDRFLEDDRLIIEGISGTSAGAINGAVLIEGYTNEGKKGARDSLHTFWKNIAHDETFTLIRRTPFERLLGGWNLNYSLGYRTTEAFLRLFSPYLNFFNYNPLRDILEKSLNIQSIQSCSLIQFFITATRVYNGQPRLFKCDEITVDALLASSCIPQIFQAVEIEGEPYWDGGYAGNPALWPLIHSCSSPDIVLIQINPLWRKETPRTPLEITNRLNEITFNSSLTGEMRMISFISNRLKEGHLDPEKYKDVRFHMLEKPEEMMHLNASSKFNCEWRFLTYLRELGYHTADTWLRDHFDKIGVESSTSIEDTFLKA